MARAAGRRATPDPAPTEAGEDGDERGPTRRCIVTRQNGPREEMLRFVLAPGRMLVPDLFARLPGRGMWLSARADVLEAAIAKGAFSRAARGPVTLPPDLAGTIRLGLERRATDRLGLARRAGQAVGGFAKVREALAAGQVGLVVQASDGSEDECRRVMSGAGDVPVVRPFPAAALGKVFGRDHLVHVAVAPGRLAEGLRVDALRLAGMEAAAVGMNKPAPARGHGGSNGLVNERE